MKKLSLLILLTALLLACNNRGSHSGGFQITGTISGFDSSYVTLKNIVDGDINTIDSVFISNNNFTFSGEVDNPELCFLVFGDMKHLVKIFLDNSLITFNANIDSLDNAIITGSRSHSEFKSYEDEILPFENKMADLSQQFKAASDQNNIPLQNQVDSLREALKNDMDDYMKNYIGTHKSSLVSPYILSKLANKLNANELDSMLRLFNSSLNESIYTQNLKQRLLILKKTETGKKAPEFSVSDTSGNDFSLSDYRGKFVLISFWAAWNGASQRQNINIQNVYKQFNTRDFEIIGISLDNDREQWTKAIKQGNWEWKQGSELRFLKSEIAKNYAISEIPSNVLIDKEGIIIAKNLNQNQLVNKLNELLK